MNTCPVRRFD